MKVVQINSACSYGSTGRIAVAVSELLDSNKVENLVFYSGNRKSDFKNAVLVNTKVDIRLHQVLSRLFGDQGWHSSFYTQKLISELKRISPDLVHLHNLHGYYLNMTILFNALAEMDIPVIWTLHDCWAFTGHCTHYTIAECDKWKSCCKDCPQAKSYPYSWFFDRSETLFERKAKLYSKIKKMEITTVSRWLAGEVKNSKLLGDKNVTVIPNGLDLSVFYHHNSAQMQSFPKEITEKKIILGVANSWGSGKGLQDFIKLCDRIDCEKYRIVLVGVSLEQQKHLPKDIIGLARTDSVESLAELYSLAEVYVNLSIEETFGMTTLEAMACGTPVVVYSTTANPELVTAGTGIAVAPHDFESVVSAIDEISKNRCIYSKKCRHFAEHYNANNINQSYLDLYRKVMIKYGEKGSLV